MLVSGEATRGFRHLPRPNPLAASLLIFARGLGQKKPPATAMTKTKDRVVIQENYMQFLVF